MKEKDLSKLRMDTVLSNMGVWKTLDSGGDYTTIDFAVSENLLDGKSQAVLQIYHQNPNNQDDIELGGVIYLKEEKLLDFIQNLVATHLKMVEIDRLMSGVGE